MKRSMNFKSVLSFLILTAVILSFSACTIDTPEIRSYVDNVKSDMLEAVNNTRRLKKEQQSLDIRKKENADQTQKTLENLEEIYSGLLKLEAPSEYDELDSEIKKNAKDALGYVSELHSLVKTAADSGNDSLYKQESVHIMNDYEIIYTNLVDLNSQVTTKYRKD